MSESFSYLLPLVYAANVLVAGTVGVLSFFAPHTAAAAVFSGTTLPSPTVRLVGALWLAIAICSALGVSRPIAFAPVLLLQLIYKSLWLLFTLWSATRRETAGVQPTGMNLFFLVWVVMLPLVIPWRELGF